MTATTKQIDYIASLIARTPDWSTRIATTLGWAPTLVAEDDADGYVWNLRRGCETPRGKYRNYALDRHEASAIIDGLKE